MVLALSILTNFLVLPETPKEAIEAAIKHYQSLTSYSVTIECHDASGLFPGNYEQSLKWKKGGRFEIIVTKKSDYSPKPEIPGSQAPDYFSNGTDVLSRRVDGRTSVRSIVVDANTKPGWEVTTGLLLGWLQNSKDTRFLFAPPESFKVDLSWGERKEWESVSVREAIASISGQGRKLDVSVFLAPNKSELIGQEYTESGKRHWSRYRDAIENPELPATLGDHPK